MGDGLPLVRGTPVYGTTPSLYFHGFDPPYAILVRSGGILDRFAWLRSLNPRLVLDGGANEGQWLGYMRQFWPWVHVVCFEPLAECAAKIPRNPLTWVVQGALGAGCGEVEFHRSSFAQSSSMLAMGEAHKSLFPFSKDHDVVKVVMTTLDAFFDGMEGPDVVKLDLQGYELEALKGGERVLSGARALCVETSFVELYDGQPLFGEVHEWLRAKGWRYRGAIEAPMLSGEDGTPLEEDSWFSR